MPTIIVMMLSTVMSAAGRVPMCLPSRMTVTVSHTRLTSSSLCEMYTHATPLRLRSSMMDSSTSISLADSEDVGSSRINSRAFLASALAISKSCWWPLP